MIPALHRLGTFDSVIVLCLVVDPRLCCRVVDVTVGLLEDTLCRGQRMVSASIHGWSFSDNVSEASVLEAPGCSNGRTDEAMRMNLS